jgi:glycosyltransferase involved in cell wall biosynthesis
MTKRVALYYPWIHLRSGVERCILELVRRSRHEYTVYASHVDYDGTFPEFRDLKRLVALHPVSVERSLGRAFHAAATIAAEKLDPSAFDALLVSSEGLGDFITLRNHAKPVLCYCHTLARPVYDPVYRRILLEQRPGYRLPLALFRRLYHPANRRAWRHYRHVFANGSEVRRQIVSAGLSAADRVEVVHPGVDEARLHPSTASEPYFLFLSRVKWTKNVELAIRAFLEFRRMRPSADGWRLIVAGDVDRLDGAYLRSLRDLAGPDPAIEFRLDPAAAEIDRLYHRCYALVFPSLSEPWGMVPVEAMASAKPVLAVNHAGPTETVQDGVTGFLLEPRPEAFAERMAWLVEHPEDARRMGAAAAAIAQRYTWSAFVTRLDEYVEQHC